MRLILISIAFLISVCSGRSASYTYTNLVDSFQNFNTGTVGSWVTQTILQNSAAGSSSSWLYWDGPGTGTNFESWRVVSITPFELPTSSYNGTTYYTNTGTKAIEYDHFSTNRVEAVLLRTPGYPNLDYSNMVVRAFIKFGNTTTNSSANFDTIYIEGGTFCACQSHSEGFSGSGTDWYIYAHSQDGSGSTLGNRIKISPTEWYYVELLKDVFRETCELRVYDPITFKLIGHSFCGSGGSYGTFSVKIQAHYFDNGATIGTTSVAGVSISYSNVSPALKLQWPLASLVRSESVTNSGPLRATPNVAGATNSVPINRHEWIPGTNVGVIGGIPARTGTLINVTASPYFADNTGVSDASTPINNAIAAAVSNDVVYLPPGIYYIGSQITLNKHGITLRGSNWHQTIVVGPIASSSTGGGEVFAVHSPSAIKGSNVIAMVDFTDVSGNFISANDMLEITQVENDTDNIFPVWSALNARRTLGEVIQVVSRSGTNLTLAHPLSRNYTNQAQLRSLNLTSGAGNQVYKLGVGIEYMQITTTNSGLSRTPVNLVSMAGLRNSWIKGCKVTYPINYALAIAHSFNCQIESNYFGRATSIGNSRSGVTEDASDMNLFQNNIYDELTIGWQNQGGGSSRNAHFAELYTNCFDKAMLWHHSHPFYTLTEQCKFQFVVFDGFFGSQSHMDVFRNEHVLTFAPKRNVTYVNFVGNVAGTNGGTTVYEATNGSAPFGVFLVGQPNVGNSSDDGTRHPPVPHNWPGPVFGIYTNVGFKFTQTVGPTNVLWTNWGTGMTGAQGTFTNIPVGSAAINALGLLDGSNTNKWWDGLTNNGNIFYATVAGTPSNLTLNTSITVSNGQMLFVLTPQAFQQRNETNRYTDFFTANRVMTNAVGVIVYEGFTTNYDKTIPRTLLYARQGAPSWWGTNRWPAIDPESTPSVAPIPPEQWHSDVMTDGDPVAPPESGPGTTGLRIRGGRNKR